MAGGLLAWTVVTNTAAVGVSLTGALAIGVLLLGAGRRAHALRWTLLFGATLALVLASKLAFYGWGVGVAAWDFIGFSGHAARAGAIMPVLGWLLGRRRRVAGALLGAVAAVLVAVSRVVLGAHSPAEAASGCVLGLACALAMLWTLGGARVTVRRRPLAVLCVVLLAPLPGPARVHGEGWTTRLIMKTAVVLSGHERPYTRADLRASRR